MVTTMRRYVAVAVLAVALTGCDDGGEEAGSTTSEAPTTTAATTTVPETTTTVPFEVEFGRAVVDLLEIRNEVFMAPDLARVGEYLSESCVCLERERGIIEGFVTSQTRWTGPAVVALGIRVDASEGNIPAAILVARQPEGAIVGGAGETVEPVPEVERAIYTVTLVQESGHWRINSLSTADALNPAVVEDIVEEGLP